MKIIDFTPKHIKTLKDVERYLAECVTPVRDKSPKSPEKLFNRLMTESIGDKPSRVLEYIPCVVRMSKVFRADMSSQTFGFIKDKKYHTNARELLNWGWSIDNVLEVIDFTHYKVFRCVTPYFIYGQLSTHTQLTTVSHSQRYAKSERGYWMPPEISGISQAQWDEGVAVKWRPMELQELMRKNGITRKEVLDRGKDMLQMRAFTIGGFTNNPNAWDHFIDQRSDLHTQYETRNFVEGFVAIMNNDL